MLLIAFILSRTVGLPGGCLESWASEPEDILGLVSLGLELASYGCCCCASITRARTTIASFRLVSCQEQHQTEQGTDLSLRLAQVR